MGGEGIGLEGRTAKERKNRLMARQETQHAGIVEKTEEDPSRIHHHEGKQSTLPTTFVHNQSLLPGFSRTRATMIPIPLTYTSLLNRQIPAVSTCRLQWVHLHRTALRQDRIPQQIGDESFWSGHAGETLGT